MSQKLPTGGFKWVTDIHLSTHKRITNGETSQLHTPSLEEKIRSYDSESNEKGYILEVFQNENHLFLNIKVKVDLDYPTELHDLHDTYPCVPEHKKMDMKNLSTHQRELAEKLKLKDGGEKLCLTLEKKTKCKLHIRFRESRRKKTSSFNFIVKEPQAVS